MFFNKTTACKVRSACALTSSRSCIGLSMSFYCSRKSMAGVKHTTEHHLPSSCFGFPRHLGCRRKGHPLCGGMKVRSFQRQIMSLLASARLLNSYGRASWDTGQRRGWFVGQSLPTPFAAPSHPTCATSRPTSSTKSPLGGKWANSSRWSQTGGLTAAPFP